MSHSHTHEARVEYRCTCGHFHEEHTEEGGCEGCDNGGHTEEEIMHSYVPDPQWPVEEDDTEEDTLENDDAPGGFRRDNARHGGFGYGLDRFHRS